MSFSRLRLVLGTGLLAALPLASLAADPGANPPAAPTAPASANADDDATPLADVVVTATRMPQAADTTGSSVTVITRQEIDERQYQTVVQALQQVPGLSLSSTGTPGQTTAVLTRGLDTNQTLVLIDGRRLPQDLSGAFDLTNLPLDNVERIEMVRGPLSAVQGGNAAGGVINIITRSGLGMEKPEYTVSAETGSYNTFHEVVTARGMQGPVDYSVAASSLDTTWQRANNDYNQENVDGNVGYQLAKDLRLTVGAQYRSSYSQNPGQTAGYPVTYGYLANDPGSWFLRELWSANPVLEWKTTEEWTQTLSYLHSQQRDVNYASPASLANYGSSSRTQIDADQVNYDTSYAILDNLKATAGTEFRDQDIWSFDDTAGNLAYANHQTNTSGFAGLDYEPLKDWRIDPSVRIDHYSDYGTDVNYRVATSYRTPVTRTLLHGSYGLSTTPPAESYFVPFPGQIVNYGLTPERTEGFDAGAEQPFFGGKWTVGATYFQNNIANAITSEITTGGLYTSTNAAAARTQGVEITSAVHPLTQLDLSGSYTYLDAKDLSTDTLLVRRPRNTFTFAVTERPVKGVVVSAEGSWVNGVQDFQPDVPYQQIHIADYFVARLVASWQVNPHLQFFGRLENAFNEKYEEAYLYPQPDQAFYGGVKLTF